MTTTCSISAYFAVESELGIFVLLRAFDGSLRSQWPANVRDLSAPLDAAAFDCELIDSLQRYFAGHPTDFGIIATPAGPPFFQRCWDACRSIPRGETRSYGWLARQVTGSLGAARAAGQSMRRNPLPVIIPCHRVIAATGDLHGFAGSVVKGGEELSRKEALLRLEGNAPSQTLF